MEKYRVWDPIYEGVGISDVLIIIAPPTLQVNKNLQARKEKDHEKLRICGR